MEELESSEGDTNLIHIEVVPAGSPEARLTRVGTEERVLDMATKDFEMAMKGVADVYQAHCS